MIGALQHSLARSLKQYHTMVFTPIPNHLAVAAKQRTTTLTNAKMMACAPSRNNLVVCVILSLRYSVKEMTDLSFQAAVVTCQRYLTLRPLPPSHKTHQGEMLHNSFPITILTAPPHIPPPKPNNTPDHHQFLTILLTNSETRHQANLSSTTSELIYHSCFVKKKHFF